MPLTLQVQHTALSADYCFSTWAQALADFSATQFITFSGSVSTINFGFTKPTPENRAFPWWRTDANSNPAGRWTFNQGVWLREHPLYNPDTNDLFRHLVMWEGASADVPELDGGDAGSTIADVADTSGPMWEEVSSFAARMPIGAGTLPSAVALAVGDTGGEEKHTLSIAEMPNHFHGFSANDAPICTVAGGNFQLNAVAGTSQRNRAVEAQGGDTAHNNLPPYFVIRYLRKTLRKFYRLDP